MQHLVVHVLALDPVPTDNNVKAGWVAFAVFLLLIAAVAFLCWSFVKQLRKVEQADAAGVYDEPEKPRAGSTQVSERNQDEPDA